MNLVDYPHKSRSITQFEQAHCFDLVGNTYRLIMDGGYDYDLYFASREKCEWNILGKDPCSSGYFCLKADDDTYFITVQVSDMEHHIYVLDFAQRLVTRLHCPKGLNPKFPHLITISYDFGAIDIKGFPIPFKRHSFTSETLGTTVRWRWSMDLFTKHAYLEADYYRITWDDDSLAADSFDTSTEMLPSTDEHARYIKIKDNMYLFTLSEENSERALFDLQHFRGDILSLLQNYDRMFMVGCGFGAYLHDGAISPLSLGLTAYGKPVELSKEFLEAPNPFIV